MKTVCKHLSLILMLFAISVCGVAQKSKRQQPNATTQNLVRGVIGPVSTSNSWANYSVLNLIPGSGLFPISSSSTVFYFGFTAGSAADISNMVVYTTARGSQVITAVTPVTLGGVSNPSINLSSASVCPVQPPSTTNPCIVRFDPASLTLSPSSDYYFVVYYANDTNNQSLGGAIDSISAGNSLNGTYAGGDSSHLTVGQSVPAANGTSPYFLMYVMNN